MNPLDEVVKKYQLKVLFEILQEKPNLNVVANYMEAIQTINGEFHTNYRSDLGGYIAKVQPTEFLSAFPLKED